MLPMFHGDSIPKSWERRGNGGNGERLAAYMTHIVIFKCAYLVFM